jgi:hypothetical protein
MVLLEMMKRARPKLLEPALELGLTPLAYPPPSLMVWEV